MRKPNILYNMSKHDQAVFASYVLSPEGQTYTNWEFNVLTGDLRGPGRYYPPSQRKQAIYLNALKIDVIAWLFDTPAIIEVKPHAGLSAIGQAISYRQWYSSHFVKSPSMLVVCSSMSDQVRQNASWSGIRVVTVPPANEYQIQTAIQYVIPLITVKSVPPSISDVFPPRLPVV